MKTEMLVAPSEFLIQWVWGVVLRICIANKFLVDTDAGDPRTTL